MADSDETDPTQLGTIVRDTESPDVDIEELIGEEIDPPIGLGFDLTSTTYVDEPVEPSEDGR